MALRALFTTLLCFSHLALAEWEIATSVGYGQRSNPLVNAESIETVVNFDVAWYGNRFFFDNGDLGFNLANNKRLTINAIAQINSERAFFDKTNTQYISIGGDVVNAGDPPVTSEDPVPDSPTDEPVGDDASAPPAEDEPETNDSDIELTIPKRDYALEGGIEAIYDLGRYGDIYSAFLQDISNTHDGNRLILSYQNTWLHKRWATQLSSGIKWQNSDLNTYYFGVNSEEANVARAEYSADSGVNYFSSMLFTYAINPRLFWGTRIAYESLSNDIYNSPLVVDKAVYTVFSGVKYKF